MTEWAKTPREECDVTPIRRYLTDEELAQRRARQKAEKEEHDAAYEALPGYLKECRVAAIAVLLSRHWPHRVGSYFGVCRIPPPVYQRVLKEKYPGLFEVAPHAKDYDEAFRRHHRDLGNPDLTLEDWHLLNHVFGSVGRDLMGRDTPNKVP